VAAPEILPIEQQLAGTAKIIDQADRSNDGPIAKLFTEVNALATRLKQRKKTTPRKDGDLPRAEQVVLDIIDRFGSLTVPQIARERCTSRQNIQILVDRLRSDHRVELIGNPAHKRSPLVRLTEQGKMQLAASEITQRELILELRSVLSEAEVSAAVALLRRIHGLLSNRGQKTIRSSTSKRVTENKAQSVPNSGAEAANEAEAFPLNLL
jgi:DNA-binding MarR family transcriptional regulator